MAGSWTMEYAEAWSAGYAEGRATAVLRILQNRGIEVTGNTWEHITACSDLATLTHWLNRSITVTHAEDLFRGRGLGHATRYRPPSAQPPTPPSASTHRATQPIEWGFHPWHCSATRTR
jgi:hypothetical protein